jgi:hypothetical protein
VGSADVKSRSLSNVEKPSVKYVCRYHATQPAKFVTEQEAAELSPEWAETYIHQNYPSWRSHWTKKDFIVKDEAEDKALGGGWADTSDPFEP